MPKWPTMQLLMRVSGILLGVEDLADASAHAVIAPLLPGSKEQEPQSARRLCRVSVASRVLQIADSAVRRRVEPSVVLCLPVEPAR